MAQKAKLPFNEKPQKNINSDGVNLGTVDFQNGYIEMTETGDVVKTKRNGLELYKNIVDGAQIDSPDVFWWDEKSVLIIINNGQVFVQNIKGESLTDVSGVNVRLELNSKCTFATNGDHLAIANGGRIVLYEYDAALTNRTEYIADADAPTECSHVCFLDYYLLANNVGTAQINFSDFQTSPTNWRAIDAFVAESSPDNVLSIYVNNRTLIIMGARSIEFWGNNGIDPFYRIQGQSKSSGVMSKYCMVFANNVGFFFDEKRRLNRLDGGQVQIVNSQYDRELQRMETVTDCEAFYQTFNGKHLIHFNFPTEDKTFVYDVFYDYWVENNTYDSSSDTFKMFLGKRYAYANEWNLHLFTSKNKDKLFKMADTVYEDDNEQIKFLIETGTINHGTFFETKQNFDLIFNVTTGQTVAGQISQAILHIKDENNGVYDRSYVIDLGTPNSTNNKVTLRNLGIYKERQYKLEYYDNSKFILNDVLERLTVNDI